MKTRYEPRTASLRDAAREAPMLDLQTEQRLALASKAGDRDATQQLVVAHLRLVIAAAQPYVGGSVSLDDLVSEGCVGLMEAARRFDPERGNRFSTYAVWWVRAHLRRFALANRRIVSSPSTRNARRILGGMGRAQRQLTQELGRAPHRDEIAEVLGVPAGDVAMVEAAVSGRDVTLSPADEGPSREIASEWGSPEDEAAATELRAKNAEAVAGAMDRLSDREQEIVRRRLLDEERMSLAALGQRFGVSRERVRQIQQRAQAKLRVALVEQVA